MEHIKNHQYMATLQERDREELRETLQKIAHSVEELRAIQNMPSPAAVEIMQSIEEVSAIFVIPYTLSYLILFN